SPQCRRALAEKRCGACVTRKVALPDLGQRLELGSELLAQGTFVARLGLARGGRDERIEAVKPLDVAQALGERRGAGNRVQDFPQQRLLLRALAPRGGAEVV